MIDAKLMAMLVLLAALDRVPNFNVEPACRYLADRAASPDEMKLCLSHDGAWCHQAFARDRRLHFPLVADFEPKGAVARQYRAYRDAEGVCERAMFVLDREGVIFWSYLCPVAVNPGADGILDALEKLTMREKSNEHTASLNHVA
jgi:alkyl hydroperoxide reductase subunit AhpC